MADREVHADREWDRDMGQMDQVLQDRDGDPKAQDPRRAGQDLKVRVGLHLDVRADQVLRRGRISLSDEVSTGSGSDLVGLAVR